MSFCPAREPHPANFLELVHCIFGNNPFLLSSVAQNPIPRIVDGIQAPILENRLHHPQSSAKLFQQPQRYLVFSGCPRFGCIDKNPEFVRPKHAPEMPCPLFSKHVCRRPGNVRPNLSTVDCFTFSPFAGSKEEVADARGQVVEMAVGEYGKVYL
jgi:hypothetical protein